MSDRRRYVEKSKPKKNKKGWKVIFLVSFALCIFIYYQVFVLFKYTTGQTVTENQMAVYKWVSSKIHQ